MPPTGVDPSFDLRLLARVGRRSRGATAAAPRLLHL